MVITDYLNDNAIAGHLEKLADAFQVLANLHNSLSAHRQYCIILSLNNESKKVAKDR